MRVYAVADIHGQQSRIEKILDHAAALHPDVLVVAGDITGHAQDQATISRLGDAPVPVLAIRGNIDAPDLEGRFQGSNKISSLHLHEMMMGGIPFFGIGGSMKISIPMATIVRGKTVLVTHIPPWGVLDKGFGSFHGGSRDLARMVLEKQPLVVICGHMHENRGIALMGESLVVNCSMGDSGAGALIEIEPDQPVKAVLL